MPALVEIMCCCLLCDKPLNATLSFKMSTWKCSLPNGVSFPPLSMLKPVQICWYPFTTTNLNNSWQHSHADCGSCLLQRTTTVLKPPGSKCFKTSSLAVIGGRLAYGMWLMRYWRFYQLKVFFKYINYVNGLLQWHPSITLCSFLPMIEITPLLQW